jgi:tRNA (cytidine32/uridine32-2'-O)-methyltransferase
VLDARECGRLLVAESEGGAPVSVLFGPERTGLSNDDLDRCNFAFRIPTSPAFSSLNLAAAVQLLCYEVHMAVNERRGALAAQRGSDEGSSAEEFPSQREMEFFYAHLERTLDAREFTADTRRGVTHAKLRRLFGRARPKIGELKMLHSLVRLMHRDPEE